jgi:HEAT repeat protein
LILNLSKLIKNLVENAEKIGKKEAIETLHNLYKVSDEWEVRKTIIESLIELEDTDHFNENVSYYISDENENVRSVAAELLGKYYYDKALEPFRWVIEKETDSNLKWFTYRVLKEIGSHEAKADIEIMIERLIQGFKEEDLTKKIKSAKALGILKEKTIVDSLIKAMKSYNHYLRVIAIEALGEIGDKKAVIPLIKSLNMYSQELWDVAFNSLQKLLGDNIVDVLIKFLETSDKSASSSLIRGGVIEALGKLGDKKALDVLLKALDDYYFWVRWKAKDVLNKLDPKWREKYKQET